MHKTKVILSLLLFPLVFLMLAACSPSPATPPTPTPPPTEMVAIYLDQGELGKLEQFWRDVIDQQPDNPQAAYRLALILTITAPDEADEYFDRAEELQSDYTDQINRVREALRRGRAADDWPYYLTQVGQALASLEEWQLAEFALQIAVAEDPEYAEAWAFLGEALYHTGKDGYQALETAIQLNPNSYAANIFMGMYWRRSEQPAKALRYMQIASSLDPDNLDLLEDLANTLIQAGMIEAAFDKVRDVIAASPEDSEIWAVLARVSIENSLQVAEVGLPAARKAVVLNPDDAGAKLLLGRAYLLLGNTQLAERFFNQASQDAPDLAEPYYYLGLLYFNLYDFETAQTHLRTAVQLAEANGNTAVQILAEQVLEKISP